MPRWTSTRYFLVSRIIFISLFIIIIIIIFIIIIIIILIINIIITDLFIVKNLRQLLQKNRLIKVNYKLI